MHHFKLILASGFLDCSCSINSIADLVSAQNKSVKSFFPFDSPLRHSKSGNHNSFGSSFRSFLVIFPLQQSKLTSLAGLDLSRSAQVVNIFFFEMTPIFNYAAAPKIRRIGDFFSLFLPNHSYIFKQVIIALH